jgi:hypothetical protein
MKVLIATKPSVRLLIAIFYLGSLVFYIAYLGTVGISSMSGIAIALQVASVATWAAAGLHNIVRRSYTKIWEIKHGNVDDEKTLIRPSSQATVNAALNMASSASSLGGIIYKTPNLAMVDYIRMAGYGFWFSTAATHCWLSRAYQRRHEIYPAEKIRLCGARPEIHNITAEVQIISAGILLAAAIWLDETLYPLRATGNISWLVGASLGLSFAIYEYVEARRADEEVMIRKQKRIDISSVSAKGARSFELSQC